MRRRRIEKIHLLFQVIRRIHSNKHRITLKLMDALYWEYCRTKLTILVPFRYKDFLCVSLPLGVVQILLIEVVFH